MNAQGFDGAADKTSEAKDFGRTLTMKTTIKKFAMMTRVRRKFHNVLKNKAGQSTTEYILILAIVVMIASKLKTSLNNLVVNGAMGKVSSQLNAFDADSSN
jgi:hypothetical protein